MEYKKVDDLMMVLLVPCVHTVSVSSVFTERSGHGGKS